MLIYEKIMCAERTHTGNFMKNGLQYIKYILRNQTRDHIIGCTLYICDAPNCATTIKF